MSTHDWSRLHAGEWHDFHNGWIAELRKALNTGVLPDGYFALAEQQSLERDVDAEKEKRREPDILTLERVDSPWASSNDGGVAVAEPKTRLLDDIELDEEYAALRRTIVVRHVSDDRPVAMLEIVSPGNKESQSAVESFVRKCTGWLKGGLHLGIVDLFPPRKFDPFGLGVTVAEANGVRPIEERVPGVSFEAGPRLRTFGDAFTIGKPIPPLPLFYAPRRHVMLPLQETYDEALIGVPKHLKAKLEAAA